MGKVIKCKYDINLFTGNAILDHFNKGYIQKGQTIYVKDGAKMKFYVDESCFDDTVFSSETKWAFIYEQYFNSNSNNYNTLWADVGDAVSIDDKTPVDKVPDVSELLKKKESNMPIAALGIGTQYKKGKEFTISPVGANFYYGFKQRVVVFTDNPKQEFYFFVTPYTDPNITYAFFDKNIKPFRFGDIVNLTICLHQYPDYVGNRGSYFANIYLLDKDKAVEFAKRKNASGELISQTNDLTDADLFEGKHKGVKLIRSTGSGNINNYITLGFPLSLEWRNHNLTKKQRYLVPIVEIFEVEKGVLFDSEKIVDYRNFAETSTSGLMQYDPELIGMESVETYNDQPNSEILVEYETTDEIRSRIEREKGEMIQYIGDIRYTKKEYDPCGYSKIILKDETDKERDPFVIFNENAEVMDQTEKSFDIIAGDEKKTVSITVENLSNKGVPCTGVLLPAGQKHDVPQRVFLMDRVLVPKLIPDTNKYATRPDPTQKGDNDVYVDENKSPSGDVSDVQGLVIDKDYEYVGENKLQLNLNYVYNKNYEQGLEKVLGWIGDAGYSVMNTKVRSVTWVGKYFLLSEQNKQIYFVPISTCRYPNQLARISVYPDLEWWINVKYGTENPLYVRQKPNYGYRSFVVRGADNLERERSRKRNEREAWSKDAADENLSYKLAFEAGFKVNGREEELLPGDGFPLLRAINFILNAYELFKKLSFVKETKDTEHGIAAGIARTSEGQVVKKKMSARWKHRKSRGLPLRIDVTMPSFSGGVHGKYAQSINDQNRYGKYIQIGFAAKPFFGIKGILDLLFYAQFIGPIGQAMYRLSQIVKRVDYVTLGAIRIDYFLNLGAKADLNIEAKVLQYHLVDGWKKGGDLQIYLPIQFYIEAGADINVKIEGVAASMEASAEIKGEANLEMRLTYDRRENKCPALLAFQGLDIKIWLKFEVKEDNSEEEGDSDYITNFLNPKKPWEFDILNIL